MPSRIELLKILQIITQVISINKRLKLNFRNIRLRCFLTNVDSRRVVIISVEHSSDFVYLLAGWWLYDGGRWRTTSCVVVVLLLLIGPAALPCFLLQLNHLFIFSFLILLFFKFFNWALTLN